MIVDINVDIEPQKLDRGGTKGKGRLFAVSSNPRAPATLPRTISQDSDVQASLRYTDDEVGSIRSGAGSVSSLPRRGRTQNPRQNTGRNRLLEEETDHLYSDAADSYVSVRVEQAGQQRVQAPNIARDARRSQDRYSQDRHSQERHSQDQHSDSDSAIQRFESVDSGGSFPAPPRSNGSRSSHSIQYKSESASGSYKSDQEIPHDPRYPNYDTYDSELSEMPQYSLGTRSNSGYNPPIAEAPSASTSKLVDALRKSSPLNNRPIQNLPPRYVPAPMPTSSNAEKEVQRLTANLNEMRDEYEMGRSAKDRTAAQLERKDKELSALRKVLRDEVKSHDDEIEQLRALTRDRVEGMKIEIEQAHNDLAEAEARLEVAEDEENHDDDHRKEIVVDNLKMAKQLNHFRRQLDERTSDLESTSKRLNDEKKMNEQIAARLETYIKKVKTLHYFYTLP